MSRLFGLTAAAMPLCIAAACAGTVSGIHAAAIQGRIVSAATGEPLGGAIVVARWNLEGRLHGEDAGNLTLQETTTGADGRFRFAAWGPRRIPPGVRLDHRAPRLIILADGHLPRHLANEEFPPPPSSSESRESRWNDHDIALQLRRDDPPQGRIDELILRTVLASADACAWESVPRFTANALRYARQHALRLPSLDQLWVGSPTLPPTQGMDTDSSTHRRCSDPRITLKEFL